MMILKRTIVSPGLAGVDVANGRPLVFKPENYNELQEEEFDDGGDEDVDEKCDD